MKKLPEIFDVRFCSCCECMTWHTADGQCEWSNVHENQAKRRLGPFRQRLGEALTETPIEVSVV